MSLLLGASALVLPWRREQSFDWELLRRPLRFGLTLIPHAFALWAIMLADRVVLSGLVSAHELGLYSLAANIGVPIGFATAALNQSVLPRYAKAGRDDEDRGQLRAVITQQISLTTGIALAGALLGGTLLTVLAAPSYAAAAPARGMDRSRSGSDRPVSHPDERRDDRRREKRLCVGCQRPRRGNQCGALVAVRANSRDPGGGDFLRCDGTRIADRHLRLLARAGQPEYIPVARILGALAAAAVAYAGGAITAPGTSTVDVVVRLAWLALFGCRDGARSRRRAGTTDAEGMTVMFRQVTSDELRALQRKLLDRFSPTAYLLNPWRKQFPRHPLPVRLALFRLCDSAYCADSAISITRP